MRTLISAAIIFICSIIISSCESHPKNRIEVKFQGYINNNFGNPKDLVENRFDCQN